MSNPLFFLQRPVFFQEHLLYPGGLSNYISSYLVQFYRNPWLGAFIVCLLGSLIWLLTRQYIIRLKANVSTYADILALVPSMCLMFLASSPFYQLTEFVALLLVLFFTWLYIRMSGKYQRFVLGLLFSAGLYLLTGAFAYIFVILICTSHFFTKKTKSYFTIFSIVLFTLIFPYISRFLFFQINNTEAYLSLLPYAPNRQQGCFSFVWADAMIWTIFAFYSLLPFVVLILNKADFKIKRWVFLVKICIIMGIFVFVFQTKAYSSDQMIYEKINYYAEQEDWQSVWQFCKDYIQNGTTDFESYYQTEIQNYTKLSALMTDNLPETYTSFLNLPGFNSLLLSDPTLGYVFSHFESDFYYNTGLITMSRQIMLGIAEVEGMSNRALRRLLSCNLVIEDSLYNQKYVYVSERTPNNKNVVSNISHDKNYLPPKQQLLATRSYEDMNNIDINMLLVDEISPQNPYTLNYACMLYLLYFKDEGYLINNLHRFKKLNYNHIPTFFEEALIISLVDNLEDKLSDSILQMDFTGYKIREETLKRYESFWKKINQGFGNIKTMEKEFYDTYYFHKYFRITEIQLQNKTYY